MKNQMILYTGIFCLVLSQPACKKNNSPAPVSAGDTAQWVNMNYPTQNIGSTNCMMQTTSGKLFVGIFAGSGNSLLYSSTDTGVSWQQVDASHSANINGGVAAIRQDPANGTILLACNNTQYKGLYYSTDDGNSWTNNPDSFRIADIAFMNGKAYMTLPTGVSPSAPQYLVSSTDDFKTVVTDCSDYPTITEPWRLFVNADTLFTTQLNAQGIFRSQNPESQSWTGSDNGIDYAGGSSFVKRMFKMGNYLFAGTTEGIFRSADGGRNWTQSDPGFVTQVSDFAVIGNNLYAAMQDSAIYRSTDNGQTWAPYHNGLAMPKSFVCLWASGHYLLAGGDGAKVYRIKVE